MKEKALGEFPIFYGVYPEGSLQIALYKAAKSQKENPKSYWLEKSEDRV